MINVPGLLVPFQLLIHPRVVLPGLVIKDIRQLDFPALRKAGYRGAVFDKDNCLTIPYKDSLVPELQEAWKQCKETFGEENVVVVSNSAGTKYDAGGIQAESVSHHLGVPVLQHGTLKPGYACIAGIRSYFASLFSPTIAEKPSLLHSIKDEELIVVGDRVFTDVVMANRMARRRKTSVSPSEKLLLHSSPPPTTLLGPGPLSIWTTGVWKREAMAMRWLETALVRTVARWNGIEDVFAIPAPLLVEERARLSGNEVWPEDVKARSPDYHLMQARHAAFVRPLPELEQSGNERTFKGLLPIFGRG